MIIRKVVINQSTNQSTNQPFNHSIIQSFNHSIIQSFNRYSYIDVSLAFAQNKGKLFKKLSSIYFKIKFKGKQTR
ncbi:MAG: hypothetical protein ACI952_001822, partial [Flavobacteriales bacterium]